MFLTSKIEEIISSVLGDESLSIKINVEVPRVAKFGDFSSNVAMKLAPVLKKSPLEIAKDLVVKLKENAFFKEVSIEGPGFINFKLSNEAFAKSLAFQISNKIKSEKKGEKILVEYGSANPTGPLHVGHGRNIIVGDVVANVLSFLGYDVLREYYINDAGAQISNLEASLYARCKEHVGEEVTFPEEGYRGDYVKEMASDFIEEYGGDLEASRGYMRGFALKWSLNNIEKSVESLGVKYSSWISEASLHENSALPKMLEQLKEKKVCYEKDGALWSRTTSYGDDKDRVILKNDGTPSYYASDILYSRNKVGRGYNKNVTMLGADHHGYLIRFDATFSMWGGSNESVLIQLVQLYRGGELVKMSKRAGNFYMLDDLLKEVDGDIVRAFFLMRRSDTSLDFDIDLANSKSNDNPYHYIQYAHARISSILREIDYKGPQLEEKLLFSSGEEKQLIKGLDKFEDTIKRVGENLEVHLLLNYAKELASLFHTFYSKNRVIVEDEIIKCSRIALCFKAKETIGTLLKIMGIKPLEKM